MNIMRECFTVNMAGLNIEINTVSTSACVLCRKYLTQSTPEISVKVIQSDVDREYKERGIAKHNKVSAETTAVYRKIVESVLDYNIILMHGAVVAVGDHAYMFSAPSGTGKTTHIKLWLNNIKDAYVINGDKPLLKIANDRVMACGTPWSGNENMNTNTIVPLKSIVLLERDENNCIEQIGFSQAYIQLLQQTYIPKDKDKAEKTLSLLASLQGKVGFYRLKCNNFKDDCFRVSYKALVQDYSD